MQGAIDRSNTAKLEGPCSSPRSCWGGGAAGCYKGAADCLPAVVRHRMQRQRLRRPPQRLRRSVGAADQWEQREHQREQQSREQQSREHLRDRRRWAAAAGVRRRRRRRRLRTRKTTSAGREGTGRESVLPTTTTTTTKTTTTTTTPATTTTTTTTRTQHLPHTQQAGRKAGRRKGPVPRALLTSRSRAQLLT